MNFGVNLCDLGELDESVKYLRESLGLAPGAADCHLNLGNTLARQGDLDAALFLLRRRSPSCDPITPRHVEIVRISG